jgi:hypothetical protein
MKEVFVLPVYYIWFRESSFVSISIKMTIFSSPSIHQRPWSSVKDEIDTASLILKNVTFLTGVITKG